MMFGSGFSMMPDFSTLWSMWFCNLFGVTGGNCGGSPSAMGLLTRPLIFILAIIFAGALLRMLWRVVGVFLENRVRRHRVVVGGKAFWVDDRGLREFASWSGAEGVGHQVSSSRYVSTGEDGEDLSSYSVQTYGDSQD